jgi:hypothetical protein
MKTKISHMYTMNEAATGYAEAAERLLGDKDGYLETHSSVVPIFVSHLFQSLEISIKVAGIESGLFTMVEARRAGKGHGIDELASLATDRLGGKTSDLVTAMTFCCSSQVRAGTIIKKMIKGTNFAPTRKSYLSRRLGYGEVTNGEIQILQPINEWVAAVKETAAQLNQTVHVLTQWRNSPSASKHFAIWFNRK